MTLYQPTVLPLEISGVGQVIDQGVELIADPIHEYIPFTVPLDEDGEMREITEKDLIDSPWMQRLRSIAQLQSARWVFPAAEHSRFQHSLGTMHIAGRFARQLYPSLCQVASDCPSLPCVETVLRVSGLLHDVGHGPFCHFFDENYLVHYGIGHEALGHWIITHELGPLIRKLRRSPSGALRANETVEPGYIAYLMQKKQAGADAMPQWLHLLKPVLGGMYTADNLDYVLRDAYMCGVAVGPVDLGRLIHYSFISQQGLTLHSAGVGALTMFLTARLYLHTHVYFHRTIRAIDLHLREIFHDTMQYIFPGNPLDHLDRYVKLTDWSLLETVREWVTEAHVGKRKLGEQWATVLRREVKWKLAYDATLSVRDIERRSGINLDSYSLLSRVREVFPSACREVECELDIVTQKPRNINVWAMGEWPISIYDSTSGTLRSVLLDTLFEHIPPQVAQVRFYTTEKACRSMIAQACEVVLSDDAAIAHMLV